MAKEDEKEPKKSKLQQQFTDALPAFLPLIAGGLLGGLETGVAAQEGANKAISQAQAQRQAEQEAELAARELEIKEAKEAREDRMDRLDLSLRERQVALAERQAQGGSQGKQVTSATAQQLGELGAASGLLDELSSKFDELPAGASVMQFLPATDASRFDNNRRATAQTVGKILEGGKLTDVDFEKYLDLMPSQSDSKATATSKINTVKKMIELSKMGQLDSLKKAGFNVNQFIAEEKQKAAFKGRLEQKLIERGLK